LRVVVNEAKKILRATGKINLTGIVMFTIGFWCVLECKRCSAPLDLEKYYLFGAFYCRACENIMTHDPEYKSILARFGLKDIEC